MTMPEPESAMFALEAAIGQWVRIIGVAIDVFGVVIIVIGVAWSTYLFLNPRSGRASL